MKRRNVKGMTVVLTGASSGIGRAIAMVLANEGANLVLASRREDVLKELAQKCEKLGAQAKVVKTDVTDQKSVVHLMESARTLFGKIDVWINNAGAGAFGEYDKTPIDVHEQVIRTNLLGYMYGTHAILPHFKRRNAGILINTISIGAYVPSPYAVAYAASKFGLRGFGEALRAELSKYTDIHVCDVHPAFIDTPGFEHAANYSGKELKPAPPVYDPYQVAEAVLSLIMNPRDSIMVGNTARLAKIIHAITPSLMGKTMAHLVGVYLKQAASAAITSGSLFVPLAKGTSARGGWMKRPSIVKKYLERKYSLKV